MLILIFAINETNSNFWNTNKKTVYSYNYVVL